MPHGHSKHTPGCYECQEQSRTRIRKSRAANAEVRYLDQDGYMVSFHPSCEHGTYAGYIVYSCRCVRCRTANADRQSERRSKRRSES